MTFLVLVYVYSSVMKSYLDRIYNTAIRDPLTGLYNRTFAFAYLRQELEKVKRGEIKSLCIVYIDLDNFKYINDLHGHSAGDLALKEIAELIRRKFRKGDVVARIGGDEFLIVVSRCRKERIENRLEELKAQVEDKFREFNVSISYGIAVAPLDSTDIEELVKIADKRMYSNKKAKKGECRTPSIAS
ncbi:GGDEF domain-containing protein [Phorcysia thermohydrogeniphila]|nr:GGDEF domain-containing protein [Phorcysia thermohydrogeniphila]